VPRGRTSLYLRGGLRSAPNTASMIMRTIPKDVTVKMSNPDWAATAAVIPPNNRQKASATQRNALRTLGSLGVGNRGLHGA
jgi:hypothetical protein